MKKKEGYLAMTFGNKIHRFFSTCTRAALRVKKKRRKKALRKKEEGQRWAERWAVGSVRGH